MIGGRAPLNRIKEFAVVDHALQIDIAKFSAHLDLCPDLIVRASPVRIIDIVARAVSWVLFICWRIQNLARDFERTRIGRIVLVVGVRRIATQQSFVGICDCTRESNLDPVAHRPRDGGVRLRAIWLWENLCLVRQHDGDCPYVRVRNSWRRRKRLHQRYGLPWLKNCDADPNGKEPATTNDKDQYERNEHPGTRFQSRDLRLQILNTVEPLRRPQGLV